MAPPEKQGANDANNFRRDYAAALAQALRESEENNRQPPSDEELLQETYVQLCYDDPIVTESGCNLLAAALIRPKQPGAQKNQQAYALSNQLMEGIHQTTSRISRDPPQSQCDRFSMKYRLNLPKTGLRYKNPSKICKIVSEVKNRKSHLARRDTL